MAKKNKENMERKATVRDLAHSWLRDEDNLYMNIEDKFAKLDQVKGKKRDISQMDKLVRESERLVDEYLDEVRRVMRLWLGLNDEDYQMRARNLVTLGEKLKADALDDLEPIVAEMKEVKAKMEGQIEAEILKGSAHVEKCRAAVEHEEIMCRIKNEIADLTVHQNRAKKTAKELGKRITEKADKLEEMEMTGPSFGPLFEQPSKDEQKKKQIEAALGNCPDCDGTGIYEGEIECETCDGTGNVKPKKYVFNEHNVCSEPDLIEFKFPGKLKIKAEIRYAQGPDGKWYHGFSAELSTPQTGAGFPVSLGDKAEAHDTKEEAISQAARDLKDWIASNKKGNTKPILDDIDKQMENIKN